MQCYFKIKADDLNFTRLSVVKKSYEPSLSACFALNFSLGNMCFNFLKFKCNYIISLLSSPLSNI